MLSEPLPPTGAADAAPAVVDTGVAKLGDPIGVRALARNLSGVLNGLSGSGRLAIVTKHGAPIAALVPFELLDPEHWPGARTPVSSRGSGAQASEMHT